LAGGFGELEIIPAEATSGATCDAACATFRAKDVGARYLITGSVSRFGGQLTLQIEALDRTTGAIAASGSTPPTPALVDLLPLVGAAANDLRNTLVAKLAAKPAPIAAPQPAPAGTGWGSAPAARPAPRPSRNDDSPMPMGNTGLLVVTSEPPGANTYLGHSKVYAGVTPTRKHLPPGGTRVTLHLDGYFEVTKKPARVFTGETTRLHVVLRKKSPFVTAGASMAGFGIASTLTGVILIGVGTNNPDKKAALNRGGITMLVAGGALAATGAIFLIVQAAKRPKKKPAHPSFTMAPTPGGVAMTYGGTF